MGDTMIESLYIENFAIIDQVQIDFQSGMTVLTGETGAGKSIIIDAIGPVSYTHLDVYKRQIKSRWCFWQK